MKRAWEFLAAWWMDGATDAGLPAAGTGNHAPSLDPDTGLVTWYYGLPEIPADYGTVDYLLGINPFTGAPAWRAISGVTFDAGFGSAFGAGFGES